MLKRAFASVLAAVIFISMFCGCKKQETTSLGNANISCGVMGDDTAFNQLKNGIAANIDVAMAGDNPEDFDILYIESGSDTSSFGAIDEYVYNGGTVVINNEFVNEFSKDFLGAEEIVKIEQIPVDLEYLYTEENLTDISELLYDYTTTLKDYLDFSDYLNYDYGYGIIPSTAKVIAGKDGVGIYTINHYGKGTVFITNPMLPAKYGVTELAEGEDGQPMASTTVAAESLLRSYYAEYVSKRKYDFALERTFGSFASNPAAWELHYEEILGIKNGTMVEFAKYCMENDQLPSFTLVRNPYTWFKRSESVTYLEYDGGYKNDAYENAYSSGTHIVSNGKWLEFDNYENTDSYFEDNPEYIKRAYPYPIDWNEDGKLDLICGSADGNIYYIEGRGMGTNYEMGPVMYLTDENGSPLNVGGYSSPVVFDINGDGKGEIISGGEDGIIRVYQSLKNDENPDSMAFSYIGDVLHTGLGDSMPAAGYLNDDNIIDIAVGSRTGEMRVYYGYTDDGKTTKFGDYVPVITNEDWVSPCIYDGKLFGGTREGYIATYDFDGNVYKKTGYMEADTNSRRGNKRISIGMNSVPRFYDIDGDGDEDLLCGSLEYGMAYPIDSEYFPYGDELQKQLDFCRDNGIYIGVHGLTHKYASPEQETKELEYHKKAFDYLGLDWSGKGINQHTWFASKYGYDGSGINGYNPDYNGTFKAQSDSGLLWNDGSTLPESDAVPQNCAENSIPMPMYMEKEDFIVFEPSNTPHGNGAYSYLSVKYDMPLLFYNHCDNMYKEADNQKELSDKVGEVVDKYDYMFVSEEQMAKSVSASYNTDIKADINDGVITITKSVRNENVRLFDKRYTDCIGIKVVFADDVDAKNYVSDANVCRTEDNVLYASLGKTITVNKGQSDDISIKSVNIPAEIKKSGDKAIVKFKDDGQMCVRVKGEATTNSKGWKIKKDGDDTVFIKFGKSDKIKITRE